MTADDVRAELVAKARSAGNAAGLARSFNVSPTYISDVCSGRREPGEKILQALGLERVVTYRRKKG